jgi:5-methylcytosine-specific restriction endonuclease McrA
MSTKYRIAGLNLTRFLKIHQKKKRKSPKQKYDMAGLNTTLSKKERHDYLIAWLRLRRGDRCTYCGRILQVEEMTLEHIRPKSKGGPTVLSNLTIACGPCNNERGNQPVSTYLGIKAKNRS